MCASPAQPHTVAVSPAIFELYYTLLDLADDLKHSFAPNLAWRCTLRDLMCCRQSCKLSAAAGVNLAERIDEHCASHC